MSLDNTTENLGDLSNGGALRWPLQLFVSPPRHLSIVFLPIGGGLLFRGREISHSGPLLTPGNLCRMLLIHYVNADFTRPLD
jgi:hypothetical protein